MHGIYAPVQWGLGKTGMDFDVGARLKELRTAAGLSQRDLAARAGVPHGLIATVEQNKSSPSVASLRKILDGLAVNFVDFFSAEAPQGDKVFFGHDELIDLTSIIPGAMKSKKGRITFRQVGDARAHNLQILHEVYEPGADTGKAMLAHESKEGGVVIAGELELTVGQAVRVLKPGEAYLFDSRIPHRFRNVGSEPCEVVSACTPPYL
jgi:transcriptional regulator with XRE-family HTH domain